MSVLDVKSVGEVGWLHNEQTTVAKGARQHAVLG